MTDEEYQHTQACLVSLGHQADMLDLDAFIARINRADALGPVLDPTLYRKGMDRMHAIGALAAAARHVAKAHRKLETVVRAEHNQTEW